MYIPHWYISTYKEDCVRTSTNISHLYDIPRDTLNHLCDRRFICHLYLISFVSSTITSNMSSFSCDAVTINVVTDIQRAIVLKSRQHVDGRWIVDGTIAIGKNGVSTVVYATHAIIRMCYYRHMHMSLQDKPDSTVKYMLPVYHQVPRKTWRLQKSHWGAQLSLIWVPINQRSSHLMWKVSSDIMCWPYNGFIQVRMTCMGKHVSRCSVVNG